MNSKDIIGGIQIADDIPTSELPVRDELDEGRRCFKKGRHEYMGGPVYYEQAHDYEVESMNPQTFQMETTKVMNNNRKMNLGYPMGAGNDPVAKDLQVDITEQ